MAPNRVRVFITRFIVCRVEPLTTLRGMVIYTIRSRNYHGACLRRIERSMKRQDLYEERYKRDNENN